MAATWVLTLILLHYDGLSVTSLGGFASEAECRHYGDAWLAQANRRPDNTDVPLYRCKAKEQRGQER